MICSISYILFYSDICFVLVKTNAVCYLIGLYTVFMIINILVDFMYLIV